MYYSRFRSLFIVLGVGLALGCVLGALQFGIDLYNESVYVSQATQIPSAFMLILWLLDYLLAGFLAGIYTKKEHIGIIAGLCGLLIGTLADIAAPIILSYHRYPAASSVPHLFSMAAETLVRAIPQELLMLGLAGALGFLGNWLASQRRLRRTASTQMMLQPDTTEASRRQPLPLSGIMDLYIVFACAFIVFVNRVIGFPLIRILGSRSYSITLNYIDNSNASARIAITGLSFCGVVALCLCTFIIAFLVGKQSNDRRTRSRTIFWMVFLGSMINIGTLIAFIYNGAYIDNIYGQPGVMLMDMAQPYLSSLFSAIIYLLVGVGGAVLLGILGASIGTRKNQPRPKEDQLLPSSLKDDQAEQSILALKPLRQD